jgi:hypothetical protein
MTAYYSPASAVRELCLLAPSKLSAVRPLGSLARAGQDLMFEIELAAAEDGDVAVALASSDPSALEVPPSVVLPKGERTVTFVARTRRPGHVEVSASLAGATVSTPVRVAGLVLSEVFYQPATGATDELQWIELANQSEMPIDLSRYSLGAGASDFLRTRVGMPLTIPPRGCVVIGGPLSAPANGNPAFDLAQDLAPDLGTGGDAAAGVALFGGAPAAISGTARPLDAIVYAGQNLTLRGPDGELAPVWPGALPGGSLRRLTETVWTRSGTPTPGSCEVLDAH